jgi:hypothetical protein
MSGEKTGIYGDQTVALSCYDYDGNWVADTPGYIGSVRLADVFKAMGDKETQEEA